MSALKYFPRKPKVIESLGLKSAASTPADAAASRRLIVRTLIGEALWELAGAEAN